MSVTSEELAELRAVCSAASLTNEGGGGLILLPELKIPVGDRVETRTALLTMGAHSGYTSRLFLSKDIPDRGANWTSHVVLGTTWRSPSWNHVPSGRPIEMLQQHLRAYR